MNVEKLFIDREDDRLTVVSILAKNGYTVMIGRQKRPNRSKSECYVGYEPGPSHRPTWRKELLMTIKKTIKVMSYELDCVKRQVGPGCNRNCRDCDLALSDDLVIDAFETVMDILRAQQKAEKNEPLTTEELRGMDGQPVWCVTGDGVCFWALLNVYSAGGDFYAVDNGSGTLPDYFYNMTGDGEHGLHIMGWLAYRRPPKEDEDG